MTYLFFGYLVVWVGLAIYLAALQRRAGALEREVHSLREQLAASGSRPDPADPVRV
ncbi:MAG: CcmD family protein [Armatimonadota bacterium]|nr:CcmD family protein [Armatimonadota bacterium]MDR5698106.1 CcmD family protein [Armatimonadota bacterium]